MNAETERFIRDLVARCSTMQPSAFLTLTAIHPDGDKPSVVTPETWTRAKGRTMKLITNTQISVDGVVQGNGGRDENRSGGFERGGWARPLFDSEGVTFVNQFYQRADAFLFGRRTYDLFAGYWGVMELGSSPIADALNTKPKYVASNTLTNPRWANTTVLSGDLAAAISKLKAKPGGELQVHGSGTLTRWLIENNLVDEMNLLIVPVVVGQGMRLFPDSGPDMALDLVESRAFPKGIILQVYQPNGRPQYAP
jgi:dihydrofolate reductase